MQSSVSDHQEQSHRLQQVMSRRLQEKEHTIKAQREQVSSHGRSRSSQPRVLLLGEDVGRKAGSSSGYPGLAT